MDASLTNQDVDVLRSLLAICTRQGGQGGQNAESPKRCFWKAESDVATVAARIVRICAASEGVLQAVALQALKVWVEDHEMCVELCIRQGNIVPILLSILSKSLPAATRIATAAYCASMAVILLRVFVRDGGVVGANAFLTSNGVKTLLELIDMTASDDRSLCLALYLLNDTTRRSMAVLEATIEAGAVRVVVDVLKRPNVSEATKFAALILNRWSLAAQYLHQIQESGASEALLGVLKAGVRVSCTTDQAIQDPLDIDDDDHSMDPYTAAYALSAFAMVNQGSVEEIQRLLLADEDALFAISSAIVHYEACFDGVGFPHLLMSQLIEEGQGQAAGAAMIIELARLDLVRAWLQVKHVGRAIIDRCMEPDVVDRLSAGLAELARDQKNCVQDFENYMSSTIALLENSSPDFLLLLIPCGRLEVLFATFLRHVLETRALHGCQQGYGCKPSTSQRLRGLVTGKTKQRCCNDKTTSIILSSALPKFYINSLDIDTGLFKPPPRKPATQSTVAGPKIAAVARLLCWCVSVAQRHNGLLSSLKTLSGLLSRTVKGTMELGSASALQYVHVNGRKRRRCQYQVERQVQRQVQSNSNSQLKSCDVGRKRYDSLCFVIGKKEIHAVGFVLESQSTVLHELLASVNNTSEKVVIPVLPGFSCDRMHSVFLLIVEWCYTGVVDCVEHNDSRDANRILDLWKVADFLQMEGLQCYCEDALELLCAKQPEIVSTCLRFATSNLSSRRLYRVVARYSLRRMLISVQLQLVKGGDDLGSRQGFAGGWPNQLIMHETFVPLSFHKSEEVIEALAEEMAAEIREILVELQATLA